MNLKDLREFCTTPRETQVVEAVIEHKTEKAAAAALGDISRQTVNSTIRRIQKKAIKRGYSPEHDMTRTVPEGFGIKGISSLYDQDGVLKAQWVKSNADREQQAEMLEQFIERLCSGIKPAKLIASPKTNLDKEKLTAYPLGDPHIGLATYLSETGEEYDLAKAKELFITAFKEAVAQANPTYEGMILNVGDLYHADNAQNQTRRSGNALDVSGGFSDRFEMGYEIMIQLVFLALQKHEIVHVYNAIGNHDEHMSIALMHVLKMYFAGNPRVKVYTTTGAYQYHRFGKNLFGLTHGDQCKLTDLPEIMATDRASDWGETRHRKWFTGHIHHDTRKDLRGCNAESFRTLAPQDGWHKSKGYRSDRDIKVIEFHKDHGEVNRRTINITQFSDVFKEYAA
jgi:hypothetical protein